MSAQQPIVLEMKTWRQRNCWARLPRYAGHRNGGGWHGGTAGHCGTWHCRTPWEAVWGSWKLHNLTSPVRYDGRRLVRGAVMLLVLQLAFLVTLAATADGDAQAVAVWASVLSAGALGTLAMALSGRAR